MEGLERGRYRLLFADWFKYAGCATVRVEAAVSGNFPEFQDRPCFQRLRDPDTPKQVSWRSLILTFRC